MEQSLSALNRLGLSGNSSHSISWEQLVDGEVLSQSDVECSRLKKLASFESVSFISSDFFKSWSPLFLNFNLSKISNYSFIASGKGDAKGFRINSEKTTFGLFSNGVLLLQLLFFEGWRKLSSIREYFLKFFSKKRDI